MELEAVSVDRKGIKWRSFPQVKVQIILNSSFLEQSISGSAKEESSPTLRTQQSALKISVQSPAMSSKDDSLNQKLARAKASQKYRAALSPEQRAMVLHQEFGIAQRAAAEAEDISRGSLQRAITATSENREIGKVGRPLLLSKDSEQYLKDQILQRSSSLNAMTMPEILEQVRPYRPIFALIFAYF